MPELLSADDYRVLRELDEFALLACQKYNLGNEPDWFGSFRGGLYGFLARVRGIQVHNCALHNWFPPRLRGPEDTDYNLSSIFFNMDSAIECFTFALNALGFAAFPKGFSDIADSKKLRKIAPNNVLGNPPNTKPLPGYSKIFPNIQNYWQENRRILDRIFELHDVSKHRRTIYRGGQYDMESPPGFFESLGMKPGDAGAMFIRPHKEIILEQEPKIPRGQRAQPDRKTRETLEEFLPKYSEFLRTSGRLALQDSRANIPLSYSEFQEQNT